MAETQHTQTHPKKVVLPHVRRYSAEVEATLDPFVLALYRERQEMLQRFKNALIAAGVEFYVEEESQKNSLGYSWRPTLISEISAPCP